MREAQLKKCVQSSESLLEQIEELDHNIADVTAQIKAYESTMSVLNQTMSEKSMVRKNIEELKGTLQKELSDSDSELKRMLEKHRETWKNFGSKISELVAKKLVIMDDVQNCKNALESQFSERGVKVGNLQASLRP